MTMVLWCKACNALMGVRDATTDWTFERTSTCPACLQEQLNIPKTHDLEEAAEKARASVDECRRS
jgi:hypothetical protein